MKKSHEKAKSIWKGEVLLFPDEIYFTKPQKSFLDSEDEDSYWEYFIDENAEGELCVYLRHGCKQTGCFPVIEEVCPVTGDIVCFPGGEWKADGFKVFVKTYSI